MAFDKIYYFDKTPTIISGIPYYFRHEYGEIQTTFNMSFVIDGTKDSCKVTVYNNNQKELDPLTIIWFESTNTWWVVKSDQVTRYANEIGAYYQHEISLYGAFEILNARDLTNCGFNANRYTLNAFLTRLETLMDFEFPITWDLGVYADKDQTVTYLKTFQNYTPASAIKELFSGMNLVPKLIFTTNTYNNQVYIAGATIIAYSRSGENSTPINISTFDNEEEKSSSDIESFGTRVISNVQNCVSADPIRYPAVGSVKLTSHEATVQTGSNDNAVLRLPEAVYQVNKLFMFPSLKLVNMNDLSNYYIIPSGTSAEEVIRFIKEKVNDYIIPTDAQIKTFVDSAILIMENGGTFTRIPTDTYSGNWYELYSGNTFNKEKFALNSVQYSKTSKETWDTVTWEQGKDEITNLQIVNNNIINPDNSTLVISRQNLTTHWQLQIDYTSLDSTTFAVEYIPMGDIKVKVDNDKEQNDSNLYNQNGKLVDSVAMSKLVNSHSEEIRSNEITRYKTYRNYFDIPKPSKIVIYNNEKYIINNVSIDFYENDDNGYFMSCQFTLTKQVACKSTMISANTNIRDYDCPQQNNVPRIQVYRDYIEFGYSAEHSETPYLSLAQTLKFDSESKGMSDNHTCVFSSLNSVGTYYYQIGTSKYNLNKQFIEVANFKDNNIIGYEAGKSYWVVQASTLLTYKSSTVNTPISYVDNIGELTGLSLRFVDEEQLTNAYDSVNATEIVGRFVTVPTDIWNYINADSSRYDIAIDEATYRKDGLEVPVFEYACQVCDNNDIVFGADFLKGETGEYIKYYYSTYATNRISQENATKYFGTQEMTTLPVLSGNTLTMTLNGNTQSLLGKNICFHCDIYKSTGTKTEQFYVDSHTSAETGNSTYPLPTHGQNSVISNVSIEYVNPDAPTGAYAYIISTSDNVITYAIGASSYKQVVNGTISYSTTLIGTQTQNVTASIIETETAQIVTNGSNATGSQHADLYDESLGLYYYEGDLVLSNTPLAGSLSISGNSHNNVVHIIGKTVRYRIYRSGGVVGNVSATIYYQYSQTRTIYHGTAFVNNSYTQHYIGSGVTISTSPVSGKTNTISMSGGTFTCEFYTFDTPPTATISFQYLITTHHTQNVSGRTIDGDKTFEVPSSQGILNSGATITVTGAYSDPYAEIVSFDSATNTVTFIAGDRNDISRQVDVRIYYRETYSGVGLATRQFLFAVNDCKVNATNTLTLYVNNWKLK